MRLVCLPTKLGILGLKLKVNIIYPTLSILVYIYICYHLVKLLMLVVYLEFCKNYIYMYVPGSKLPLFPYNRGSLLS